jgi:proteasome accessory factor C
MSDNASEQLRRILHLVPELADDQDHPIVEVAERLGVDRKTLLKDLRSISERYDDPGGFVEGVTIYVEQDQVSVHANHFLRPMRLTLPELAALELGLAMLRAERPPEEHRAIDGARARLREVITALPSEVAEAELRAAGGETVDTTLLGRVRTAAAERRRLALCYRKAEADAADDRTVRPYAVVHARGQWYVIAHCERNDGVRVFRLDRIDSAELLESTFRLPDDFSVEEVVRDGRVFQPGLPERLLVRYSPAIARWLAEREGRPLDADGSLTLEHPLADRAWAVRHVLQYGPDAEVLEPAAVRDAVRERLHAMLKERA